MFNREDSIGGPNQLSRDVDIHGHLEGRLSPTTGRKTTKIEGVYEAFWNVEIQGVISNGFACPELELTKGSGCGPISVGVVTKKGITNWSDRVGATSPGAEGVATCVQRQKQRHRRKMVGHGLSLQILSFEG